MCCHPVSDVRPLSSSTKKCFIACPTGLEPLLLHELKAMPLDTPASLKVRRAGVDCELSLADIYHVCLWSRVANRVLYPLAAFKITDEKSFYESVKQIEWDHHLSVDGTLAVDFFCQSSCITHSQYGAQLSKDAVVDQFREKHGKRPGVDRVAPDIRINVYLFKNRARIALDMAGSSLHRRNYRKLGAEAPLKENLAACILLQARWPDVAKRGAPLFDPMCGSGTLLIEAAMMAANYAPGLNRDYYGFLSWRQHDEQIWQSVRQQAEQEKLSGLTNLPAITGFDIDPKAVEAARTNIAAAGLESVITVRQADFFADDHAVSKGPGLVAVNPPYGERLEDEKTIGVFYSKLGRALRRKTPNWDLALFTGNPSLFHRTGLPRQVLMECRNGDIDCKLIKSNMPPLATAANENLSELKKPVAADNPPEKTDTGNVWQRAELSGIKIDIEPFRLRLKKNIRAINGWLKSASVTNYRIYDADLPDFAFALDVYQSANGPIASMQEYRAPSHIDPVLAQSRLDAAAPVVCELLQCNPANLAIKRRQKQRGESQYQRVEKTNQYHQVTEGNCRLLVNLHDYLDTGLFLDHRKIRQWIAKEARNQRFLNLYCYTAAATVHAAVGGAKSSVSVDLSSGYLEWARNNYLLNNIDFNQHQLVKADCNEWVKQQGKEQQEFDIIFLDPPTFSNSTSMQHDWDVQKNHESMIDDCMAILSDTGTLVFSNNYRRFKLAQKISEKYRVDERSRWSIQRDFARNPRIHQCWFIRK